MLGERRIRGARAEEFLVRLRPVAASGNHGLRKHGAARDVLIVTVARRGEAGACCSPHRVCAPRVAGLETRIPMLDERHRLPIDRRSRDRQQASPEPIKAEAR